MVHTRFTFLFIALFLLLQGGAQNIAPGLGQGLPPGITPADIPEEYKDKILSMRAEGKSEAEIMQELSTDPAVAKKMGISSPVATGLKPSQNEAASAPTSSAPEVVNTPDPSQLPAEATPVAIGPSMEEKLQSVNSLPRISVIPGLSSGTSQGDIFGHHIFKKGSAESFFQANRITPHDEYILGPGDRVDITAWGDNELSESLFVLPDGTVSRAYLGKVHVSGLTFGEVRTLLTNRYRQFLSEPRTTIEITLAETKRTINVNVVGDIANQGSYQINSATTALYLLYLAGGVNEIGSVRNIQIRRGGKTIQTLDLYDYLIRGIDKPVYLQENDFVFVPVQGKIVSIGGDVRRPMRYELKETEDLRTLLSYAGGLKVAQGQSKAQLIRRERDKSVYKDFNLDSLLALPKGDLPLFHLDNIQIRQTAKPAENYVQATGAFLFPGPYAYEPKETISAFIRRTGGLPEDVYLKRAYLVRTLDSVNNFIYIPIDLDGILKGTATDSDLELLEKDAVLVFSRGQFQDRKSIAIQGQVRRPGLFPIQPGMTVKDLIYLGGGLTEDADLRNIELTTFTQPQDVAAKTIEVEGDAAEGEVPFPEVDDDKKIIRRIAVGEDWENDPVLDTLKVAGYNSIKIYSRYDFISYKFLEIAGEVKRPAKIQRKVNMTLRDVLYQAGGLTPDAYLNEIELYRDLEVEERGNFNTKSPKPEIVRVRIDEDWQNDPVTDSIRIAGYYKVMVRPAGEFFKKGFADIKGMVGRPGNYEVLPNLTLRDLLYQAGGLQLGADLQGIEITRVLLVEDGSGEIVPTPISSTLIATQQDWQADPKLGQIKIHPYDQIFVRRDPNFKLQENVYVFGQVHVPGPYNKLSEEERLSSLVGRAGGVTRLAYLEGAFLDRRLTGPVSIDLHKAVRRKGSKYDIILQDGDSLYIPPRLDIVRVEGNVLQPGTTLFFDKSHKSIKYYVAQAGGFDKKTQKKMITVRYVDGRLRKTKTFWGMKFYPKVEQGSIVSVARRPEKEKKEEDPEREPVQINWTQVTAGVVSTLTLYILFRNASRNP